MPLHRTLVAAAVLAGFSIAAATTADAKCTRLGFSVNDYGKDGPTNDAKNMLDKYIAKWTAERGISKYTTGKKDVKCELFLDFIVFDEHTCRAEADVCWSEGGSSKSRTSADTSSDEPAAVTTPKTAEKKAVTVKKTTAAEPATAAPAKKADAAPAKPAAAPERKVVFPAQMNSPASAGQSAAKKPVTAAPITTGTINKPKPAAAATQPAGQ
ncbi:MAG: hypothetical protein KDJ37_08295 [Hyphomicrobiaceae bacterium]|nr:hypothetical protein [Hyphomicrobiaceae bacterium]